MAIFSLFKCNQSNRIDVRIGDGTVKITTILTVRAMLISKKNYSGGGGGGEKNRGGKNKNQGQCPLNPPTGDAPESVSMQLQIAMNILYDLMMECLHCLRNVHERIPY